MEFQRCKVGQNETFSSSTIYKGGYGVLLICRTITESKKAVEEVDDKTVYKGSLSRVQVSILVSTTVS